MTEALFKNRVPDAAARQLAVVLAETAERNLSILEAIEDKKSSPKYVIQMQKDLCDMLVYHCWDLNVTPKGLSGNHCEKLAQRLDADYKP